MIKKLVLKFEDNKKTVTYNNINKNATDEQLKKFSDAIYKFVHFKKGIVENVEENIIKEEE